MVKKTNPTNVQRFLKGIDYPIDKNALIDAAKSNGASSDVIDTLDAIPMDTFDSPNDVSKGIEKIDIFLDIGAPLGKNKRFTLSGLTDVRNEVGGYSIVKAETAEEVSKIFAGMPMFGMQGAYVEIMECMPMGGAA